MALWRGIGARKDATRGTSPIEVRKSIAALFARPGVLPGGANPLMTGDATWAYNIGIANFVTSRGASDGDQVFGNDGVALIGATGVGSTVPLAPGAGLQRIDIAWTRHPTNLENADTASEPLFGVASGVAASSNPVAPTIPAGGFEIGRNLMTSAATSTLSAGNTITQSALYTALRGAPVLCRTQAERDALTLADGLQVYRLDLHRVEFYDGTSWTDPRSGFMYGTEYDPGASVTNTVGFNVDTLVGTGVTFTITRIRRVRIVTRCRFFASTAGQIVYLRSHVIAGSTAVVAGSTALGTESQVVTAGSATTFATGVTTTNEKTIALNPGTYTAFPVGGSTTGAVSSFAAPYTAVYDAGTA